MSNFAFLQAEWPSVYDSAVKAEAAVHLDPRAACFYARRALELAVTWAYKSDPALSMPYQDALSALIHEPSFKQAAGQAVFNKTRVITQLGNQAVHSHRAVTPNDALTAVRELFHVGYWLAHTYARAGRPPPGLTFDAAKVPTTGTVPKQTQEQLQKLQDALRERDEKLSALLADKTSLDAELERLRAEVAAAKQASAKVVDTHDYSEAQTRDFFIDLLLKEAGWPLDKVQDREFEVQGMPNKHGVGYVDYVLWGDDGVPLAVVEAKRTRKSPQVGQQQAKLYADCLQARYGRRPVIFYTNGYEHHVWDDALYAPREVQGFFKKAELELMVQRRTTRRRLADAPVNEAIVERYYQTRAIRRIGQAFEDENERKALIVMATGAGKTRTVIALCDLLMRCNWAKRILFLADRVALVNQAVGAFKTFLPDAGVVNLVTDKDTEGRVFVCTYPTMMGLIDETRNDERRFGVGHFDLIVIDEAHRSVYQKYRAIFGYFDSLLVGLTATPKNEIDANTYGVFDLERGVPTDQYELEDAVKDRFLVPPRAVSVPLKFQREGITYAQLSEDEKDRWDAIEWTEDGTTPDRIEAEALNKWLFNQDTVDKVLETLMTQGQTVAGGDRLGKTIIFAQSQKHAEYIAERFDINYPKYKGDFARVVHCGMSYAQSVIDAFATPGKAPHIAVSVDMLDTGIDVPEVANLVFFKLVRSKTKFWQMVGRGTRLSPNLFGPGQDKRFFTIFDFCQNLEFFQQNPAAADGTLAPSLAKRLFRTRVELISALDAHTPPVIASEKEPPERVLRRETKDRLRDEVAQMRLDNFVVRPKRRLVEKYSTDAAWEQLDPHDNSELTDELAGLPTELPDEGEEAKRFDLIILNLQLAVLRVEDSFERLAERVRSIASALEEKRAIPMVAAQLDLIRDLQTDEWWEDVTPAALELVRKRLRDLVKFVDKHQRATIYTDFEDELGAATIIDLPGFAAPESYERFRAKAQLFLRQHLDHIAIHKLRMNRPLTGADLAELERMLVDTAGVSSEQIARAKVESHGLGVFVRSLVGLDRGAAKAVFAAFLNGKSFNADQIEFVDLLINHLTEHGVMQAALLYESPFTDVAPRGPDELFSEAEVTLLIGLLASVNDAATAAA